MGIGTGNPGAKLHINHTAAEDWSYALKVGVDRDYTKAFNIINYKVGDVFLIWGNGIVNAKTIYAEAVKVRPYPVVGHYYWPDYIFNEGYELISLRELENFIKKNKHLPDVPREKEVIEEGIDLGKMNIVLLRKIEELTLYAIDLQKQIERMGVELEKLKSLK